MHHCWCRSLLQTLFTFPSFPFLLQYATLQLRWTVKR
nr:MAG TPA: hypothetical protein [Caudoviricetes sp.]